VGADADLVFFDMNDGRFDVQMTVNSGEMVYQRLPS